jgi:hypothetical protein
MQPKLRGNPILSGGIQYYGDRKELPYHPNSLRWPDCHVCGRLAESSISDFYRGDEEWRVLDWWDDDVRRSTSVAGAPGEKSFKNDRLLAFSFQDPTHLPRRA